MKTKEIYPLGILSDPEEGIPGFLRSLLIRTNFVATTREYLGWRGLKPSFKKSEAWTCRIKGNTGVFGIYFKELLDFGSWFTGKFGLCYFPDSNDDTVELFSIEAGVDTQRPEYTTCIRDFLSYPEFTRLFEIADLYFSFSSSEENMLLTLRTQKALTTISEKGVAIDRDGETCYIVEPGGIDQNLPAFDLALPFYEVLAATLTFNLSEAPSYLLKVSSQDRIHEDLIKEPEKDNTLISLNLGYGNTDFQAHFPSSDLLVNGPVLESISWKHGQKKPVPFQDKLWWDSHQKKTFSVIDKTLLGIDDRPQFIVLSGFLGSGKTSFLQNFIEYHTINNRFVAVIQNEIGDVGLDSKLLEDEYAVMNMDEGCVCCTLIGQLEKGINQILSKFHPDVIILETSGLANPYNLLSDISLLKDRIRFDSVTVIVDASNFNSVHDYHVSREQIKAADVIVLNKIDLVSNFEIETISLQLKEMNPNVPILKCQNGQIHPGLLYGTNTETETNQLRQEIQPHHCTHSHDHLSSFLY